MAQVEKLKTLQGRFSVDKKGATTELALFADGLEASSPMLPQAKILLGKFYVMQGNAENACKEWKLAIVALEAQDIDEKDEEKLQDYIALCVLLAEEYETQGRDGSGVTRKKGAVVYGSKKTASEGEEEKWKRDKLDQAIAFYYKAMDKADKYPEQKKDFSIKVADIYNHRKEYASAIGIYEQAHRDDPKDPEWLTKWAKCLMQSGQKQLALTKLDEVLNQIPAYIPALQLLADYYHQIHNFKDEEVIRRKITFYSWIPGFCTHIDFTPENEAIANTFINGNNPARTVAQLSEKNDPASTEFLAAVCYHHYHGAIEEAAFKALKERAPGNQVVSETLIALIDHHGSVCTIKGVLSILATIKHEKAYTLLMHYLPQDVQMFPMHVPDAIATLGDDRAVPSLLEILTVAQEKPAQSSAIIDDGDSDDEQILAAIGKSRLQQESCIALSAFVSSHPEALAAIQKAKKEEKLIDSANAVLLVTQGDPEARTHIKKQLRKDNLDLAAEQYLVKHKAKVLKYKNTCFCF